MAELTYRQIYAVRDDGSMRTHVALLRGVNVGGHNRVPMAELRQIAEALGHTAVATYVNSGNVVFATDRSDTPTLAGEFATAIEAALGLRIETVVLSRAELAGVVAANPCGAPEDPKRLHVILRQDPLTAARRAVIAAAQEGAIDGDVARVVGDTVYLLTPGGIGRSDLAARLSRGADSGTARNWSTLTKLLALLDAAA
jgi:uncharacterized protein (DUF1697 family)